MIELHLKPILKGDTGGPLFILENGKQIITGVAAQVIDKTACDQGVRFGTNKNKNSIYFEV